MRFALLLAVAVAAAGLAIPAASAGGLGGLLLPSCGLETQPFLHWGDSDAYCAFPNLGFENGTADWNLSGDASVVNANEPWQVSGPGSNALQLGPGAAALSAPLPVALDDPWVRFFGRNVAADGSLQVRVLFYGVLGNLTGVLNVGNLTTAGYADWAPSQRVLSVGALPLLTSTVRVLFTNTAAHGSWQVDDVYLDPCRMKLG